MEHTIRFLLYVNFENEYENCLSRLYFSFIAHFRQFKEFYYYRKDLELKRIEESTFVHLYWTNSISCGTFERYKKIWWQMAHINTHHHSDEWAAVSINLFTAIPRCSSMFKLSLHVSWCSECWMAHKTLVDQNTPTRAYLGTNCY